jgi:ribonuclease BN (tRNA processing enzyme)
MRAVTVLGSGNAYHEDGRGHASFAIERDDGRIALVDAGATTLLRLREHRFTPADLDLVLLTHFHGDHTLGLPALLLELRTFGARTRPLTVAGPPGTAGVVRTLLEAAFPGLDPGFELRFVTLEHRRGADLGGVQVDPVAVTHRPESLGYRVRDPRGVAIAFSGDCRFDDRLVRLVDGVDVAFVEVGLPGPPDPEVHHVSVDEMLERAPELRAGRLVFTHLNDRIAARLAGTGIGTPAFDGMRLDLPANSAG